MSSVRIAAAILLASAFGLTAPALADPACLPPFIDRAPVVAQSSAETQPPARASQ